MPRSLERELAERLEHGDELMTATVIRTDGSPPSRPGARALFARDAPIAGTLGCSEFDSAAQARAAETLDSGRPTTATFTHALGSVEVFLEPHLSAPWLAVFAATPVAAHLLALAPAVGFRTVLVESRPERLERFGAVPDLTLTDGAALDGLGGDLYAVHTDHDAPDLDYALERLANRNPRFIGLMGSRRHTGHHIDALHARGVDPAVIASIRSPVGLDIGAQGPAEIALSIMAGLVAARRGAGGEWMRS